MRRLITDGTPEEFQSLRQADVMDIIFGVWCVGGFPAARQAAWVLAWLDPDHDGGACRPSWG